MDAAACSGSDVVTAQAFETLAWLISPPVVGVVGSLLLVVVVTGAVMWFVRPSSRRV